MGITNGVDHRVSLQGEHAHRIWDAIYSQNCFKDIHSEHGCNEESIVFYRIISGVHTSISMHLIRDYLLDESANMWGPNPALFVKRMADPDKCDHVRNLYFSYLFVLKAFARAAPALQQVHFYTGMLEEDSRTQVGLLVVSFVWRVGRLVSANWVLFQLSSSLELASNHASFRSSMVAGGICSPVSSTEISCIASARPSLKFEKRMTRITHAGFCRL